jgi:hypothetical protein
MVKYGTLEYFQALAAALNKDEEFAKSGISTTYIYATPTARTRPAAC